MSKVRDCQQCGEKKPEDTAFRKYYGGRKGTYRTCKDCEEINSRYKYLFNKHNKPLTQSQQAQFTPSGLTPQEAEEMQAIEKLYEVQTSKGFKVPQFGTGRRGNSKLDTVTSMIELYNQKDEEVKEVAKELDLNIPASTPAELIEWLTKDLNEYEPEYLQDVVYEDLKKKYRPQIGFDTSINMPTYHNLYKPVLDKVLERFDDYEEAKEHGGE